MTPAGLGVSCLVPLIEYGFIDWIVSTGANLYHDTHFAMGLSMHRGTAQVSDPVLRREGVVRIYDVFFDYDVLVSTDHFFYEMISGDEFQREMSTAEFHYRVGKYVAQREKWLGTEGKSLLAAAHAYKVPIYTPSPGDSSIGLNIAAKALERNKLRLDFAGTSTRRRRLCWRPSNSKGKVQFLFWEEAPRRIFYCKLSRNFKRSCLLRRKVTIISSRSLMLVQIREACPEQLRTSGQLGKSGSRQVVRGGCLLSGLDCCAAYFDGLCNCQPPSS